MNIHNFRYYVERATGFIARGVTIAKMVGESAQSSGGDRKYGSLLDIRATLSMKLENCTHF